jgi:hypothetical protein
VIINTRWNVVAKEGLVIPILSSYTQQDAFTQSKANKVFKKKSAYTFFYALNKVGEQGKKFYITNRLKTCKRNINKLLD